MPTKDEKYHAALAYLDQGLHVFPLVAGTKKPALLHWKQFQEEQPTPEMWAEWNATMDDFDIGCCPADVLFVVDGDNAQAVAAIDTKLPFTPIQQGTSKGRHFIYRAPAKRTRKSNHKDQAIDFIGCNGYFKLAPADGYDLQFLNGEFMLDDCPVFDPEWRWLLVPKGEIIDLKGAKMRMGAGALLPGAEEGERQTNLCRFLGALAANKSMTLETLLVCAHGQNQTYKPPLPEDEVARTAVSIWEAEQRKRLGPADPAIVSRYTIAPPAPMPAALLQPGGVLGQIMAYIGQASRFPRPEFALAAALACMGVVIGSQFQTSTALRANLYILAIGESGSGKDAPRRAVSALLEAAGLGARIGPGSFASPSAVDKTVSEQRQVLCLIDEIGHYLARAKGGTSHTTGILSRLTELYTTANTVYRGPSFAQEGRERVVVHEPHLCIYGTTVPGILYDGLEPADVSDGFLPRWLVFEVDAEQPPARPVVDLTVPPDLVEAIKRISAMNATAAQEGQGNMAGLQTPQRVPSMTVHENPAASKRMLQFVEECRVKRNDIIKDDRLYSGILNRLGEIAAKLALIKAVSDGGTGFLVEGRPRAVDLAQVEWAIQLTDYLASGVLYAARQKIAVNDWDRWCQKVLDAIRRSRNGLTRREISQNVRGLKVREAEEVLQMLETRGEVTCQDAGKTQRYTIAFA